MTQLIISNVKKENKYKGAYAQIFNIINEDRIFTEIYETDSSIGLVDNTYYLQLSETLDSNLLDKVLKIKNVKSNN